MEMVNLEKISDLLKKGVENPSFQDEGKFSEKKWKTEVQGYTEPLLKVIMGRLNEALIQEKDIWQENRFKVFRKHEGKKGKKTKRITSLQDAKCKLPEPFAINASKTDRRYFEGFITIGPFRSSAGESFSEYVCWGLRWWGTEEKTQNVHKTILEHLNVVGKFNTLVFKDGSIGSHAWIFNHMSRSELEKANPESIAGKITEDFLKLSTILSEKKELFPPRNRNSEKMETHVYNFFEGKGFFFSQETLSRYFLSLKTKPFVILTGISGTGKTKIAQIFADYMCQDEDEEAKEKRKAFIPVRPDWMDNKGLLGFYNILDQKYHSTPLLDLIINAGNNPEKPYFVILDEMNLAKVEYYFSDFLSIMESRTSDNPEGEKIPLHSLTEAKTSDGREIPNKIQIPQNLFFTGTVNVDETTYMFSPKVLDRANVIEFNEVNLEGFSSKVEENAFSLANPDVRNELIDSEGPFCSSADYSKFKEIIGDDTNPVEKLLHLLDKYNLHFGYRVVNEISRFVWLSKGLLGEQFDLNAAMDIQILQKILPKFHGTRGKLEKPLKDLLSFCGGGNASEEETINESEKFQGKELYPRSARKINRMLNNLKIQGYTSFIE